MKRLRKLTSLLSLKNTSPSPSERNPSLMTTIGLIAGALTAILALITKLIPDSTVSKGVRSALSKISLSGKKFKDTGDTSDLGKFP